MAEPRSRFPVAKVAARSLGHSPRRPELVRAREAEDQRSLSALTRDGDVMDRAATPDMVRLLWDVCQIPDFRKIMPDHHTSFLRQVYLHLAGEGGQLDETWVKTQIDRLTSTAGDIDALTGRLADIRTWTYISHRETGSRTPHTGKRGQARSKTHFPMHCTRD